MEKTKVFVYGSLLRGGAAHSVLNGSKFLGEDTTKEGYVLLDLGAFPGMIEAPGIAMSVAGEVYEVNDKTLANLDALEQVGRLYERVLMPLSVHKGVQAYIYKTDLKVTEDTVDDVDMPCTVRWRSRG